MKMKTTDLHTVQLIAGAVAVIGFLSLVIAGALSVYGKEYAPFVALTGACVTGLLALLAQTRTGGRGDERAPKPQEPENV